MLEFALIAGGVALLSGILMVRPLVMGRSTAIDQDTTDAEVFRDQLAELDRDLARGLITETEAEGARVEISRRLLAAVARAEKTAGLKPAPQGSSGLVAGIALMGTPMVAAALYLGVGSPGVGDQPLAERPAPQRAAAGLPANHPSAPRPSQAEAEQQVAGQLPPSPQAEDDEYVQLVARLEAMVAQRPDDADGHRLLANGLMRLGRWSDAHATFGRVVELLGAQAAAEIHANQAEAMVLATGGYVSPEAENAIDQAMQKDPSLPMARYYAGLALRQAGRLDDAITMWEGLRRDAPEDAPYLDWLNMMLAETIQARDGTQVAAAPRGPTEDDIAAANDMTPEDRQAMIEGMVASLDDRLTNSGGTPEQWVQLMASYATLQRTEEAMRVFEQAMRAYPSGEPNAQLQGAARRLGLAVPLAPAATVAGPTQEDVAAASQMAPDDRAAMIQGMVQRLEDRLVSEGGTAEDWLRLINSYVQLDRKDDAARIYKLAEVDLSNDPSRGFVREQTLLLGVQIE